MIAGWPVLLGIQGECCVVREEKKRETNVLRVVLLLLSVSMTVYDLRHGGAVIIYTV